LTFSQDLAIKLAGFKISIHRTTSGVEGSNSIWLLYAAMRDGGSAK
jgi:hypothetical protein